MKNLQEIAYDKIIDDLNNYTYKDVYTDEIHKCESISYRFLIGHYVFEKIKNYFNDTDLKNIYYLKKKKILFRITYEKYIIELDTKYINNIFEKANKLYTEKIKINRETKEINKLIKNNKVYELIIKGENYGKN